MQLGQLPAQGDGPIPQPLQQGGKGLSQAVGGFVENEGMRQAADRLQGSVTLPLFDGQKSLKEELAGGQAAGGQGGHGGGGAGHCGNLHLIFMAESHQSFAGVADAGHPRIGHNGSIFAVQQAF